MCLNPESPSWTWMKRKRQDHDFSRDLSSKNPEGYYFLWSLTFKGKNTPLEVEYLTPGSHDENWKSKPQKKSGPLGKVSTCRARSHPPFGFSARSYRSQINKYRISADIFQIVKLKLWTRATRSCLLACAHTILPSVWKFCNTFKLFMKSRWKSTGSPNVFFGINRQSQCDPLWLATMSRLHFDVETKWGGDIKPLLKSRGGSIATMRWIVGFGQAPGEAANFFRAQSEQWKVWAPWLFRGIYIYIGDEMLLSYMQIIV